jgi:NitT/TauT family transport system substrate-binding protein
MKNPVVMDSRTLGMQLGVMVFNDKEMRRSGRTQQYKLFMNAYNQACDSINKYGVARYRDLIVNNCKVKTETVDSLPKTLRYEHARGPREKDVLVAEKWLEKVKGSVKTNTATLKEGETKRGKKVRK